MARRDESSNKIEMVPLIDVIFLLLIFFLVALNIIPIISRRETLESQYAMDVVTAKHAARVDMLIQLFRDNQDQRIHHFVIDESFEDVPKELLLKYKNNLQQLQTIFTKKKRYYTEPKHIDFSNARKAIISADQWVPYEALFDVIEVCKNHDVKYYCVVDSFDNFVEKIQYSQENKFVKNYKW